MTNKRDQVDIERKFHLPLAELLDRLTITLIKQVKIKGKNSSFKKETEILLHDIDILLGHGNVVLDAQLIKALIILSQINLHIWVNKDEMQKNLNKETEYLQLLKLAHQLNGIRNSMKNQLMVKEGGVENSHLKSNFETDGLDWELDID